MYRFEMHALQVMKHLAFLQLRGVGATGCLNLEIMRGTQFELHNIPRKTLIGDMEVGPLWGYKDFQKLQEMYLVLEVYQ